jgi:gas vesicle protein
MARKPVSYLAGSVLLGTAIGAVVGLLAAPKSGRELRKTVQKSVDDARKLANDARQRVDEVRRTLPERLAELPQRASEQIGRLPGAFKWNRAADSDTKETGTHVTVDDEHASGPPPVP